MLFFDLRQQVAVQFTEIHTQLRHSVTLSHGDGIIFQRLEIDCDAIGCADLVLGVIALADVATLIPSGGKTAQNLLEYPAGFFDQLGFVLEQWKDRCLVRRQGWLEAHDDALVFAIFPVGIAQRHQQQAVDTGRRFDDVRNEHPSALGIGVAQVVLRMLNMLL